MKITKIIISVLVIFLILKFIFVPFITSDSLKSYAVSLGFYGYLVVIGYIVISHIFAPLSGTPGVLLGVSLYGIKSGLFVIYLASLISASINFYIARRFGRTFIKKLVGERSMTEVDDFISLEGNEVMWILRTIGFPVFEFVSYAAGLTKLPFFSYFKITAIATFIMYLLVFFIFKDLDFQSEKGVVILTASIIVSGLVFGFILKKYLKNKSLRPANKI